MSIYGLCDPRGISYWYFLVSGSLKPKLLPQYISNFKLWSYNHSPSHRIHMIIVKRCLKDINLKNLVPESCLLYRRLLIFLYRRQDLGAKKLRDNNLDIPLKWSSWNLLCPNPVSYIGDCYFYYIGDRSRAQQELLENTIDIHLNV